MKRRADVVCIFPNDDSIVRLIGAVLLEANDEWQLQYRYMQIEAMADLNTPAIEDESPFRLHQRPPDHDGPVPYPKLHHVDGRYRRFSTTTRQGTRG